MHSDSDSANARQRDLKSLFSETPLSLGTIDTAAVIRRSRRRRLPRQVGVGSALTLAVAGIGVAGATGLRLPSSSMTMTSASDSGATVRESADGGFTPDEDFAGAAGGSAGTSLAPVEKLNPCALPIAEVASTTTLELYPQFPAVAEANGVPIAASVTLQNTGQGHIVGTTAASPAMTLSRDGVTVWHSNGPLIALAVAVDLAPGESMTYPASVVPVRCDEQDEAAESFRDGLPALPAGTYALSAAIYVTTADGAVETVTGPAQQITLQ
ncbi:hypothetical protein [Homoserinimonas hongtaonis]|uniref:Uncharacterized protein n=1 Tax=Homoserinimonas hongtaonis TaxID=2079791 RepID=A0A2U1SX87_9MICO|nr:hypothetical protein [Salinibacterium hongtaonis]PWB96202.1 hypothetical protein DF220_12605 [Salinibacterium hongtaonis]